MSEFINPRCPVCEVRHKRPLCDLDDVLTDRPYEVGDQLDTDLATDLAGAQSLDATGFVGPLVCGDLRCPVCGLDPLDPTLHRGDCPISHTTYDDWETEDA